MRAFFGAEKNSAGEPVDAANHGRFTGSGRSAHENLAPGRHAQIDVVQHVKVTEPFVDASQFDHILACLGKLMVALGLAAASVLHHSNVESPYAECRFSGLDNASHSVNDLHFTAIETEVAATEWPGAHSGGDT